MTLFRRGKVWWYPRRNPSPLTQRRRTTMEPTEPNPIIDDLLAKATSAIEETVLRLSDAIENLERP
jgi:hypothetical protein